MAYTRFYISFTSFKSKNCSCDRLPEERESAGDRVDSDSEHEEEFYYTEIEVTVDTVTQGLSDMTTSSPTSPPHRPAIFDHDYQKKVRLEEYDG